MGILELLMKRKKETEDATNEYKPENDDLQAQLEKAERERDKRYVQKDKPKEESK